MKKKLEKFFKILQIWKPKENEAEIAARKAIEEKQQMLETHIAALVKTKSYDKILEIVKTGKNIKSKQNVDALSKNFSHMLLSKNEQIHKMFQSTVIDSNFEDYKNLCNLIDIALENPSLRKSFYIQFSEDVYSWKSSAYDPVMAIGEKLKYQSKFNKNQNSTFMHYMFIEGIFQPNDGKDKELSIKPEAKLTNKFIELISVMLKENNNPKKSSFDIGLPVELIWAIYQKEKNSELFKNPQSIEKILKLKSKYIEDNLYVSFIANNEEKLRYHNFFYNFETNTIYQKKNLSEQHVDIMKILLDEKREEIKKNGNIDEYDTLNLPPILKLHINMVNSQLKYLDEITNISPELDSYIKNQKLNIIEIVDSYHNIDGLNIDKQDLTDNFIKILNTISEEFKTFIQNHEQQKLKELEQQSSLVKKMVHK